MRKTYLSSILNNIDKEFPNSAMVYGVDENDTRHVFVLLDDDNMYFAQQVEDSDKLIVKRLDIDKIQKISFVGHVLTIQVKDKLFDLFINTDEAALRALCKEFKLIKSKDATEHCGNVMEQSFDEYHIPQSSTEPVMKLESIQEEESDVVQVLDWAVLPLAEAKVPSQDPATKTKLVSKVARCQFRDVYLNLVSRILTV